MKKIIKILKGLWMPIALMTGMLFNAVVGHHNYKWYLVILLSIGVVYSIWYLFGLFKELIQGFKTK